MKNYLLENSEIIIFLITTIVTWILGKISKKSRFIDDRLIPIQNIIITIISSIIYYYAFGSFSLLVSTSSPVTTLIYDVINNIKKGE